MNNVLHALITRPARQNEKLATLIGSAGIKPILFPTLEIAPLQSEEVELIVQDLVFADLAIFVSPNAVNQVLPLFQEYWPQLPPTLTIAAVGPSTARTLIQANIAVDFCPPIHASSEDLLNLAPMQKVKGKNIVIFAGEGGRDLLAKTLQERGAKVTTAICYRSVLPKIDPNPVLHLLEKKTNLILISTSNKGLINLLKLIDIKLLKDLPLIVISSRQKKLAQELGFSNNKITVTETVSDEAILQALKNIN